VRRRQADLGVEGEGIDLMEQEDGEEQGVD
jgi:hypothetical protein